MISSELLLTFLVALIVFGPNKLPMLAEHLGKLFKQIESLKKQVAIFWQKQMDEHKLLENKLKAEQADEIYQRKSE
ncbi:MAG: twin-arginine translocase TatA/TatE family subunit [Tatlockia sp.]|nr:twin-arginine translocase TatA/TatE family subunit [Tatlockia sp.]